MKRTPLSLDDLGDRLCTYCIRSDYGLSDVNTNQFNLCEGGDCEEAYTNYLDCFEEEEEE